MSETNKTTERMMYPRSHDWVGPCRGNVYVHCSACGKIFEILKAKGKCWGPRANNAC